MLPLCRIGGARKQQREISKKEARQRLGWPESDRILFTVRGLGPRYGIDVAIQAVAPLAAEGRCRFYIGGDGPLRQSFEQLATDLGVADRVCFMGRISDEHLALAYQPLIYSCSRHWLWNASG